MICFKNIKFQKTKDGSIGLYDERIGDIYHSQSGALKEANDKFIDPILRILSNLSANINILDICFGVGYNTKAVLNALKGFNLKIDALEFNEELILLSPFINDEINDDDIKLFLLNEIYLSIEQKEKFGEIFSYLISKNLENIISPFSRRFIKSFYNNGCFHTIEDKKDALLHNI